MPELKELDKTIEERTIPSSTYEDYTRLLRELLKLETYVPIYDSTYLPEGITITYDNYTIRLTYKNIDPEERVRYLEGLEQILKRTRP